MKKKIMETHPDMPCKAEEKRLICIARFSGLSPIHHLISLTRSSVAAAEVGRRMSK